jgi:hypothetical protein
MTHVPGDVTFLDCGTWQGDGKSLPVQRPFAVVCGHTVVLCEFSGTQPMQPVKDGPPADIERIQRLLSTLAGPMRFDVCVRGIRRLDIPISTGIHVFLPEMHLPLVPKLPDVDPNLVADPNQATCSCHGPVITRMLYGAPEAPNRYRVVAAPLSRNPNDWFYWMAEVHRALADDLIKFLDRLAKYPSSESVHLVQLGGLAEVWQGYRCMVQSLGWAAYVRPTIVDDLAPEKLLEEWSGKTIATKNRDAVERAVHWQRRGAVLLHASSQASLERAGAFVAEVRHASMTREPPSAFLALREQKARLVAARVNAPEDYSLLALSRAIAKTTRIGASLYVTSGGSTPFLFSVGLSSIFGDESNVVPEQFGKRAAAAMASDCTSF